MTPAHTEALRATLAEAERALPTVDERESSYCTIRGDNLRCLVAAARAALASTAPAAIPPEPNQVENELRRMLRNLIARIHGDGGHYVEQHGLDKALEDADALVAGWRAAPAAGLSDADIKAAYHRFGTGRWDGFLDAVRDIESRLRAPAVPSAKEQYDESMLDGLCADMNPLDRLRFFCSIAMRGQDWLDVEPFFDAVIGPPTTNPKEKP